jgi:hypothetical protein
MTNPHNDRAIIRPLSVANRSVSSGHIVSLLFKSPFHRTKPLEPERPVRQESAVSDVLPRPGDEDSDDDDLDSTALIPKRKISSLEAVTASQYAAVELALDK